MDSFGDHAVHCRNDIGVKFRHNAVRDTVCDILLKSGIAFKKEAELQFMSSNDNSRLRPADVLLYSWDSGRNLCLDLTGVSPFVGFGNKTFEAEFAVEEAARKKTLKHEAVCTRNGYSFAPFAFSTFGGLKTRSVEFLRRVREVFLGHFQCPKLASFIFPRVSFSIQKGIGAQIVSRLPINFVND
ncbi:hypothetical protein ACHQM5_002617 [Ranunculus cassubicifolius]